MKGAAQTPGFTEGLQSENYFKMNLFEVSRCFCYFPQPIGLVIECLPMAREIGIQSQVESYQSLKKWHLIPRCLTLSIIRYVSRVKWNNPKKGVVPSPAPLVAIEKGDFG